MRVNIKTTNIDLNAETENYLRKKIDSLQKFLDQNDESIIVDTEVGRITMHHQSGDIFRCEINLHGRAGHFRAESEKIDLPSAIDEARDEMAIILERKKKKRFALIKKGGQKIKSFFRRLYH